MIMVMVAVMVMVTVRVLRDMTWYGKVKSNHAENCSVVQGSLA